MEKNKILIKIFFADSAEHLHRRKTAPPRIGAGVWEAAALLCGVRWRSCSGLRRCVCDTHASRPRGGQPGAESQLQLDLAVRKEKTSGSSLLKDRTALMGQRAAFGNISSCVIRKKVAFRHVHSGQTLWTRGSLVFEMLCYHGVVDQ